LDLSYHNVNIRKNKIFDITRERKNRITFWSIKGKRNNIKFKEKNE
jgi:hypothetical protein